LKFKEEDVFMGDTQVIAANGLLRQEQRFNLIANNLSNIQTTGFKKDVPVFSKILSQSTDRFGGGGNQSSVTLFQQGDLQRTGNELNLAIEGEGFFKVQTPWGVRYTRNGNFALNQAGTLIDGNGFPVMGSRDEISLRGGKTIQVQPNGAVQADGQEVDRISLVTFADLRAIQKEGHTYFRAAEGQEEIEASGSQVVQGALESANVNGIEEMIRLIDAQRSFEACQRVIQAQDELNGKAVNELGRL
jgi:flagellar basal-body rod protein FlgG